ncbi:Centrosomal protein of 112 kDa [Acipenser ruthenus]|uniref:Centrosomal protein of 112 kDa n=1 Tax=Acipenser ruthenus TaxID=7906 RepID=A0A444UNP3_ACIRT|nr:Centrosomal protein of 112 kDa [Acipenser ruthenus]
MCVPDAAVSNGLDKNKTNDSSQFSCLLWKEQTGVYIHSFQPRQPQRSVESQCLSVQRNTKTRTMLKRLVLLLVCEVSLYNLVTSAKVCGRPPQVSGARVQDEMQVYEPGQEIIYQCNPGYRMTAGSRKNICKATGTWPSPTMKCSPVTCGLPEIPKYGLIKHHTKLTGNTTYFGDTVQYECSSPYVLFGNEFGSCSANGNWTETPECKLVTCPPPTDIENGFMSFAILRNHGYGEKISFCSTHTHATMSSQEQTWEKLDSEFDHYLVDMKPYVLKLPHKSERQRCALWIKKLCEPSGSGTGVMGRKNRNMYARLLLHMLRRGALEGPFTHRPEPGTLKTLPTYMSIYFDEPLSARPLDQSSERLPDWVTGELDSRDSKVDDSWRLTSREDGTLTSSPRPAHRRRHTYNEKLASQARSNILTHRSDEKNHVAEQAIENPRYLRENPIPLSPISLKTSLGKNSTFYDDQTPVHMHEKEEQDSRFQLEKSDIEHLNEKKLRSLQSGAQRDQAEAKKKMDILEDVVREKEEQLVRLTELQKIQAQQAEGALEQFKRQVALNSEKVYSEMKQQMEKVEADLSRSKSLHEKQSEEFSWQLQELKQRYEQQIVELKLEHEQEKTHLFQQHNAEKDSLVQDHELEIGNLEKQLRAAMEQHDTQTQEWRKRGSQTIAELESQVHCLREELNQLDAQRKLQLLELGLLREEEKRKAAQEHQDAIVKLQAEMDRIRPELQSVHTSEMELAAEQTKIRLKQIEKEYSQKLAKSSQTIADLQSTVSSLREEAGRQQLSAERHLQERLGKVQEEKRSLTREHDKTNKALQDKIENFQNQVRSVEKKLQNKELESQEQITHIRQECELKIKGLMPAALRQELEDTITSLKSQVNFLQKRASVLQEELGAYRSRR